MESVGKVFGILVLIPVVRNEYDTFITVATEHDWPSLKRFSFCIITQVQFLILPNTRDAQVPGVMPPGTMAPDTCGVLSMELASCRHPSV
jgi:hypothetical protein